MGGTLPAKSFRWRAKASHSPGRYGAAALLAASVLHYAVERPFLALRGRLLAAQAAGAPLTGHA